jgi:hemolysin III
MSGRSEYTRAERVSDGVVHVLGLVAVLAAVPVLVTLATVWRGDAPAVIATSVYGTTLIAMILCSALYNMVPGGRWSGLLRRLDHSAIYFKIAGTYTPFIMLSGGHGVALLTGLWGAALAGSGIRVFGSARLKWVALALYLGMGWVGVIAGWEVFAALSQPVLTLIAVGGLLYTAGVAFLVAGRLPFHNTIWHVFVLAATMVFFIAICLHLADTSG